MLVVPVHFLLPDKPSWLGVDWYALLAGYEWGVPLTVFGFISFVMASQYTKFNRFPLVSLFRGEGLVESPNSAVEDFLDELSEAEPESKSQSTTSGITAEDLKEGDVKVFPPSL